MKITDLALLENGFWLSMALIFIKTEIWNRSTFNVNFCIAASKILSFQQNCILLRAVV